MNIWIFYGLLVYIDMLFVFMNIDTLVVFST